MIDLIQPQIDRLRGLSQRVHAGESIDLDREEKEMALELLTADAEFVKCAGERWNERIAEIEKSDDQRLTELFSDVGLGAIGAPVGDGGSAPQS